MNRRPPAKRATPNPRQVRTERWAAYATSGPKKVQLAPLETHSRLTPFLVGGFLLLQMITLLAALLILLPTEPAAPQPITPVTATATPTMPIQPLLPPSPTPFPAQASLPPIPPTEPALPPLTSTPQPVSPTPSPPTPLKLHGVEVTQGIQVFNEPELPNCNADPTQQTHIFCNNSVPLVAGRHTMVRVYPTCADACPSADILLRLRLLKDGQEQANLTRILPVATLQRLTQLSLSDMRLSLENSVNFEFFPAPDWMAGPVTFILEAIPQGEASQPASLTLTKEFAPRKPLRVAYLPIDYQGVRPPEPAGLDYWLLRMYPVPGVEYYRLPVPNMAWEGELNKGEVLRQLLHTYWLYTQSQPPENWPDQLFGWLPQEFYNGGASDPSWCANCAGPHSSRVAFGGLRPEQDIGGPRVLVHEIAHNLGAQHAWSPTQREDAACFKAEGADIWVDPTWPYLQTPHTQEVGIDLYNNPPVIYPASAYDVMAYCARPWISPHTYRKIFNSPILQPNAAAPLPLTGIQPPLDTGQSGVLLVSAMINPDGVVSKPEIIRLESSSFGSAGLNPPPGDDYCLDVRAGDGSILAHHCFDVGFTDVETGLPTNDPSPFFFILTQIDPQAVAKITVSKNETSLLTVTPSNHTPRVTVISPNGGETLAGQQTIAWEGDDADGDALSYDLLFSADGGQSWLPLAVRLGQSRYTLDPQQLPATHNGLIRVIANDGFNTTVDESDAPFSIDLTCATSGTCLTPEEGTPPSAPTPLPQNGLSLQGPTTVQAGQTFEISVVARQIPEPGLFGLQFKLQFDPALIRVDSLHIHPDLSLVVEQTVENDRGQLSFMASRQGQAPNLTGDFTLATLTCTAQTGGQIDFTLSEVIAGARGGARLELPITPDLSLHISNN
jgi:hypothetical protein